MLESINLQLLGDVRLFVNGELIKSKAAQRRRLALLILLVRAPERLMHRERLMGMLWADHAPETARRLLNEAIYIIRRELGAELLRTVGAQLQLDARVTCDLDAFEEAIQRGALVEAVALYTGPLFGAWCVGDAPEFEQWAESERAQLSRRFADLVPRAASLLVDQGRHTEAGRLFARLAQFEPDSVAAAEGEARALWLAGEPAQAMRRLDQFAAHWEEEFGGPAPKTVGQLRKTIQNDVAERPPVQEPRLPDRADYPPPPLAAESPPPVPSMGRSAMSLRRTGRWLTGAAAIAAALTVWWSARSSAWGADSSSAPATLSPRVAILSQAVASPDASVAALQDAITVAVTNQLSVNAFGVASVAEAQAVRSGRLSLDSLIALKDLGTLVELVFEARGDRVRVTARLVDAATREVVASEAFERPFAEAMQFEADLVAFASQALRVRLRQTIAMRDSTAEPRDATARKLLYTAVRMRVDAEEVLRNGFGYDAEAARDALLQADTLLQRASRIEPRWAEPRIERLRGWLRRARMLDAGPTSRSVLDSVAALADSVVQAHANHAGAVAVRGEVHLRYAALGAAPDAFALQRAEADLRRALELEPRRAEAWLTLSNVQRLRAQALESQRSARRALEYDAFVADGGQAYVDLFAAELTARRVADALAWCRRGRTVYPESAIFYECELTALRERQAESSDEKTAWSLVRALDSLEALPHVSRRAYAPAYRQVVAAGISARSGNTVVARRALERARALVARDTVSRAALQFDEPWVHWMLGDTTRAVAMLRALVADRPAMRGTVASAPLYRALAPRVFAPVPSGKPE